MRAGALAFACTFALGSLAFACSGAAPTDLFATPEQEIGATDPASGGSASGSEDTRRPGAGGPPSTPPGSGGTKDGDGGTSDDEDGPEVEAPWKSAGVKCGDQTCAPNASFCCATRSFNDVSFECRTNGCFRGAALRCDDQTDCPSGKICCATLDPASGYRSSSCEATCTAFPPFTAVQFCDPAAPTDECAANGKTCMPSQRLPGYHACQ